ncbi:RNA polymerase sigma factor [Engelhardtia mirabilis]|uniref:RNA polymerase sigma factor n=1 Tax=Engelhardtia mirabilis TaxID=2528011 RepID=A0A518BQH0_9BACT|nr:RNA polymerase sigma factor [Planctomycetes bacterium Pla133]QDV03543.1 RNA polymerase sigma factor [Planctomycetes bacterium Pla86]
MSQGIHPERRTAQTPDATERSTLRVRVEELVGEMDAESIGPLLVIVDDHARTPENVRDAVSTRLMELFRLTQGRSCFGLLYELNRTHLLGQVAQRLRRYQSRADPNDLLQEVFFNIYRYPRRFDATREDAFRVWTATIVRNTVLKHLRSLGRSGRAEVPFEDLSEHPEQVGHGPLVGAIEREAEGECQKVYLVYLHLYLEFYKQLSDREQRALHMVEVEGASYRDAAAELEIKLENLKMVIFRARRKIYRAMRRVFDGLPPDLRAARQPRTEASTSSDKSTSPRTPTRAT